MGGIFQKGCFPSPHVQTDGVPSVYTDGACRLHEISSYGVFFGENDQRNTSGRVPGDKHTAPYAELYAVHMALQRSRGAIKIVTDSEYVFRLLRCPPSKPTHAAAPNEELRKIVKEAFDARKCFVERIPGHSGNEGNAVADAMATQALGSSD